MKLLLNELKNEKLWQDAQIALPKYDIDQVTQKTLANPKWLHFGAGNIFRAFPAKILQELLNSGDMDTGLIVCESFDYDIIDKAYTPFDNLSLLVTLLANGSIKKEVVASVVKSCRCDKSFEEYAQIVEFFKNPSLQMVSFTITEKGYSISSPNGDPSPLFLKDCENGFNNPILALAKIAVLCYERYKSCKAPLALVSMDNCSHNGEKLKIGVVSIVEKWVENGVVEKEFLDYMSDDNCISYPWSMIDKITPRPDDNVKAMLDEVGFEDGATIITDKNSYTSAFVNAESSQYLVIEDKFPNGRPCLEKAGVIFTTQDTVNKVEKMKVCTCLNPIHTSLAIFGCLFGYEKIWEEMLDSELNKMANMVGYVEGLPVVIDPKILAPKDFIDDVMQNRLPNKFMPDSPWRIATDTSEKLGIRFGETVKTYDAEQRKALKAIPCTIAGWFRYLLEVDDSGKTYEISADAMGETVKAQLSSIKVGCTDRAMVSEILTPILANTKIFNANYTEFAMADKIIDYFMGMIANLGGVREVIKSL